MNPDSNLPDATPELTQTSLGRYVLRLYVAGSTHRSIKAITAIKALCELHLKGCYELEVVDLYQHPDRAEAAQIIAAPTLVKEFPAPLRRLVGDLTAPDRVLIGLSLKPEKQT